MMQQSISSSPSSSRNSQIYELQNILQKKFQICSQCCSLLLGSEKFHNRHQTRLNNFSKNVKDNKNEIQANVRTEVETNQDNFSGCQICLGILSSTFDLESKNDDNDFFSDLKHHIRKSLTPYTCPPPVKAVKDINKDKSSSNGTTTTCERNMGCKIKFHSNSPSISLPSDLYIRAYAALSYLSHEKDAPFKNALAISVQTEKYISKVKDVIKTHVRSNIFSMLDGEEEQESISLPNEAGTLSIHILLHANSIVPTNSCIQITNPFAPAISFPSTHYFPINIYNPNKKERKRFRGEDPTSKQGGDPISNLEKTVRTQLLRRFEQQYEIKFHGNENNQLSKLLPVPMSLVQKATSAIESNPLHKHCIKDLENWLLQESMSKDVMGMVKKDEDSTMEDSLVDSTTLGDSCHETKHNQNSNSNSNKNKNKNNPSSMKYKHNGHAIQIHVAAWRRPFYLKGRYTKNRRDVSQSPFYVSSTISAPTQESTKNTTIMVRKGITSVEEQICTAVSEHACKGISTQNNYDEDHHNDKTDKTDNSKTTQNTNDTSYSPGKIVYGMCKFHASGREDVDVRMLGKGRPFVLEIIDAKSLPTTDALLRAANYLNTQWKPIHGVGIVDSNLTCATAKQFSGLQSETEDKVKHYGCVCWSEQIIPSQSFLDFKLSLPRMEEEQTKWDIDKIQDSSDIQNRVEISRTNPLQIVQATPIRVLHRRSACNRTRYIISIKAKRMNDHWFQLWVSTSAGTYVKEFVRGDLGRTIPSVASLLSQGEPTRTKVDILQLDVLGIEDYGLSISKKDEGGTFKQN